MTRIYLSRLNLYHLCREMVSSELGYGDPNYEEPFRIPIWEWPLLFITP